jgi:ATP-dependent DNA ligase
LNEHLEADGPDVFHHACMLALEGIVSKRKDSQYRSGRSPHWIKSKNPVRETNQVALEIAGICVGASSLEPMPSVDVAPDLRPQR